MPNARLANVITPRNAPGAGLLAHEAAEAELEMPAVGTNVLGARLLNLARTAAAMHMAQIVRVTGRANQHLAIQSWGA